LTDDNGWPEYSGVYCILNEYNNKTYVGSTNNLKLSEERKKKISNTMKALWKEYGGEYFGR